MLRTDPFPGLRPRRLAPVCVLVTILGIAAGIISAMDPGYGPWYLLAGPVAYLVMQTVFRISVAIEGIPPRTRTWLFIP